MLWSTDSISQTLIIAVAQKTMTISSSATGWTEYWPLYVSMPACLFPNFLVSFHISSWLIKDLRIAQKLEPATRCFSQQTPSVRALIIAVAQKVVTISSSVTWRTEYWPLCVSMLPFSSRSLCFDLASG